MLRGQAGQLFSKKKKFSGRPGDNPSPL